ncbi:hypothetical protein FGO68_gene16379 [Halteria grandinella]|uniref:Peptidyl-prolyl cis-trans isomerase n=1 Tax=Halteria grandinella TaxID=5974 RepID=A0A8J8NK68_HALGN|nr:hypothetical protein FGO68_gene16379 [Halteria grandinella]
MFQYQSRTRALPSLSVPLLLCLLYLSLNLFLTTLSNQPLVHGQASNPWVPESAWDLPVGKTVWLQVSIGGVVQTDYLEIQMFPALMPRAVENFVQLCKGNTYKSKIDTTKYLMLKGTKFFRIIDTFGIFGGDTVTNDGSNGESIYGMTFVDEYLKLTHDSPYLVSYVKPGSTPDTNNSQFMITMSQLKWLDHRYEIFGRLRNTSFALADKIQSSAATSGWSDIKTLPTVDVVIENCLETDPNPPPPASPPATP